MTAGMAVSRREFLQAGAATAAAATFGPLWLRQALAAPARAGASPYGALQGPDANSLMLPPGFSSRMVARASTPSPGGYIFPIFPDGQAVFRTGDGGWILTTNSESLSGVGAGASATRFAPDGAIRSAYRILGGTDVNCAGGPTPWGTWLSGEEADDGLIWECDPAGVLPAEPRPALGVFKHEAATVDPVEGRLYLTEDNSGAGFYRFTPDDYPLLSSGLLEVAIVDSSGKVTWAQVPDPTTAQTGTPTRQQVSESAKFNNAEGIWYSRGFAYFTTKVDKVVWAYDIRKGRIEKLFDRTLALDSSLDAVDNVTVSAVGDVLICEDGGNMEIGLITSDREVSPLLRFVGPDHEGSEVCGVVFDPSGDRLYCTSQRAFPSGPLPGTGAVYEITGPFRKPRGGVPADFVFGPPAGEARPSGPLNPGGDGTRPKVKILTKKKVRKKKLLRRGLKIKVRADEAGTISVQLDSPDLASEPGKGGSTRRPRNLVLARGEAIAERDGGVVVVELPKPSGKSRRKLAKGRGKIRARLLVSVLDGSGNERVTTKRLKVSGGGKRR